MCNITQAYHFYYRILQQNGKFICYYLVADYMVKEDQPKSQELEKILTKPTLETIFGFMLGFSGGVLTTVAELTTGASVTNPNPEYLLGVGISIAGGVLVGKGISDYGKVAQNLYNQVETKESCRTESSE